MLVCFALMPLLVYKILDPELKRTPEAKELGRRALAEIGPMSAAKSSSRSASSWR